LAILIDLFVLIALLVETLLIGNFPRWFIQHRSCSATWSYSFIWGM